MWLDRLTGAQLKTLPPQVAPGRYWAGSTGLTLNGHTPDFSGLLVDDGGQRCQLDKQVLTFILPGQADTANADLLFNAIITIDADIQKGETLPSPLMPAAVVDDQAHLQTFEEKLREVLNKGHLHRISKRPRLDMHYEDEVTDIARARRLSKGALVHLASHSEYWQRQTLSGVIPRKVMARFSEDDYGIYENRVYARLLDKIDRHLRNRLSALGSLQATLDQAMEFYESADINHRLAHAVCDIWGRTFDQSATSKVSALLNESLSTLQSLQKAIRGLQQSGLYTLVDRNAQVESGLHRTNILSHDPSYRHVAALWDLLGRNQAGTKVTAEELFRRNRHLAQAYSRYAGLVLRRALQPYLGEKDQGDWAGRPLALRQNGLEWELVSADAVLLTVVPWLTAEAPSEQKLTTNRIIAWPALDQELPQVAFEGQWVPLSPSDMYCEERFGLLVDRVLQGLLLENYGRPLIKVPTAALSLAKASSALRVDQQNKTLQVRDVLDGNLLGELNKVLKAGNAIRLENELVQRSEEIRALQVCPVCGGSACPVFQEPAGFKAHCAECGSDRYLRGGVKGAREYQQMVAGSCDFRTLGRRGWALSIES